jgi:hypothetical protein
MGYKASEQDLIAYLYGELEGIEKESMEKYLHEHAESREELEKLRQLRNTLSHVQDKEVIAPPIFLGETRQRFFGSIPYFKTVLSIAASLLILLMAAKFSGLQLRYADRQMVISFSGGSQVKRTETPTPAPSLTSDEVNKMIHSALNENNQVMQTSWTETQQKLDASITKNLAVNSAKIDHLVRESSAASQEQIRQFVAGMQAENMQLVKNYFQLSSNEQKQYVESLLVDFAKYLQQQRNDDLQVVQTQMKSLQQNTDVLKQETEQILSSIISTVGNSNSLGVKN